MTSVLPGFTSVGLLPQGDYELSFEELKESVLVRGSEDAEVWVAAWRAKLVDHLEILAGQLWRVGITEIFADGSFAEDKAHPNDIDGYFVCELDPLKSGELQRELNLLEADKIWTWDPASRRPYRGYSKKQLPMWHKYRVELYPHVPGLGVGCGIRDRFGNELEFPAAFRQSRTDGAPRGIIKLQREVTP